MTAEAFRRWYESRNLTQKQVAGLLGIAQGRVSDMATGKSPVSRQTERQLGLVTMVLWAELPNPSLTLPDRVRMLSEGLDAMPADG